MFPKWGDFDLVISQDLQEIEDDTILGLACCLLIR
jgi:hypothetical protein